MNILIVSFTFPPAPGIGGRRWVKFAKYLQRHGHRVHVIASKNEMGQISDWVSDLKDLSVSYLPSGMPKIFSEKISSRIQGVRYRLAILKMKLTRRGNYFDRALNFRSVALKEAEKIIQKKMITHIITSGAPFHLPEIMLGLKNKFPQIKFISDFRDAWTTDNAVSAISQLSPARFEFEKKLEKKIVNQSDVVVTVAPELTAYFKSLCTVPGVRFETLENGYDPDDFSGLSPLVEKNPDTQLRIVFTGTVYPKTENLWIPFVDALAELKINLPETYKRFRFDFFGKNQSDYREYARKKGLENIYFHGEVPLSRVFKEILASSLCLLILHDLFAFSLSTKFCEYISQQKKIIVLSKPGTTEKFIRENNLGYWMNPLAIQDSLLEIISDWDHGDGKSWNPKTDVTIYSLENLTQKLEGIL